MDIMSCLVMLFRLRNAFVAFMDLINCIFRPFVYWFVIVFKDDILVYLRNEVGHEKHLSKVLRILREHQLYVKFTKFKF